MLKSRLLTQKYFIFLFFATILLLTLLISSAAHAANCYDTKTAIINCEDTSTNFGIWALLLIVLRILTAGIGIVAVGGIIYAAILYASAENKAEQITKAKTTIGNVLLGVVAFAMVFSFTEFIIPGGAFGGGKGPIVTVPDPPKDSGNGNNGDSGNGTSGENQQNTEDVRGVVNFRDAAASNGALNAGTLYRSGKLQGISKKARKELSDVLGKNGTIIDLRTASVRASEPDPPIKGVRQVNAPIEGFAWTGVAVTDGSRRNAIGNALTMMANARGPVLIHCTHGKDRTGWLVAMVMFINGANKGDVMREYLKSNDSEDKDAKVKKSWLNQGLNAIDRKYNSVDGYLKRGLGLSQATINKLRQNF